MYIKIVSIIAMKNLKTYFVKAIPKATSKDSCPARTHTKVYMKVSSAWELKVDRLFLNQRYLFPV